MHALAIVNGDWQNLLCALFAALLRRRLRRCFLAFAVLSCCCCFLLLLLSFVGFLLVLVVFVCCLPFVAVRVRHNRHREGSFALKTQQALIC